MATPNVRVQKELNKTAQIYHRSVFRFAYILAEILIIVHILLQFRKEVQNGEHNDELLVYVQVPF